jgi:hypothetical protein
MPIVVIAGVIAIICGGLFAHTELDIAAYLVEVHYPAQRMEC